MLWRMEIKRYDKKIKNLIIKLDRSKRHPLIRKFSHVPFNF